MFVIYRKGIRTGRVRPMLSEHLSQLRAIIPNSSERNRMGLWVPNSLAMMHVVKKERPPAPPMMLMLIVIFITMTFLYILVQLEMYQVFF